MEVTLGGDRLGSGNKQKQELHEYYRASFNQEQDWKSTMAPGVLYPFLCIPMTNGDTIDIDLDAFVRTLPTQGPLLGSFKLQADIFSVPMRLYNGILHNNPQDIGLKMKQVYMPKMQLLFDRTQKKVKGATEYNWQINNSCLWKYLGLSGIGRPGGKAPGDTSTTYSRNINAIPALAYYDIFKNYYANKQEENAYVITPGAILEKDSVKINYIQTNGMRDPEPYTQDTLYTRPGNEISMSIWLDGENITKSNVKITIYCTDTEETEWNYDGTIAEWIERGVMNDTKATQEQWFPGSTGRWEIMCGLSINPIQGQITATNFVEWVDSEYSVTVDTTKPISIIIEIADQIKEYTGQIHLEPFKLSNIDAMRYLILKHNSFGEELILADDFAENFDDWEGDETGLPYNAIMYFDTENKYSWNAFAMNGLVVKTYQSDLFNNWIQTDWIEGENGIAALSAVNVESGTLEIDALNLAQKVYNMLNRIAVSGGTYEDWQEAVYTQKAVRKAESPIYEGGMSAEIMFEEVIASTEAGSGDDIQPLGSLAGKGTMLGKKGGNNIHIQAKEPIFVMGIVSITPRICYTQGNEWYLTDLKTYDDLHKPALDQIGFQDLIGEQVAWWDTAVSRQNGREVLFRSSLGKVVAWSNYMTAVDKAFGDFAEPLGKGFMVLSRNYEILFDEYDKPAGIKDATTYIDPSKYNYAFAYNDLAAQNFWIQIHTKAITRRVMSAHQIPNL